MKRIHSTLIGYLFIVLSILRLDVAYAMEGLLEGARIEFYQSIAKERTLDLTNSNLDLFDLTCLFQALGRNAQVKKLVLNRNKFGDEGIKEIAKRSVNENCVSELYVASNKLSNQSIKALCELLSVHKYLEKIDLSKNKIGDEGAEILAVALRDNTSVMNVNLSSNKVSDLALIHFLETLEDNRTLQFINLENSLINDDDRFGRLEGKLWLNRLLPFYSRLFQLKVGKEDNSSLLFQLPKDLLFIIIVQTVELMEGFDKIARPQMLLKASKLQRIAKSSECKIKAQRNL